jgi:hypothetical protein
MGDAQVTLTVDSPDALYMSRMVNCAVRDPCIMNDAAYDVGDSSWGPAWVEDALHVIPPCEPLRPGHAHAVS